MMCCAIAGLLLAIVAALRNVAKHVLAGLSLGRWAQISLAIVVALAGGTALAARQLDHASEQSDLAAALAWHICGIHLAAQPHIR